MVLLCTLLIIVPPPRLAACLRCVFFRYWSFRISNSPYCCTAVWCSVRTLLNSSSTIPCAKKLAVMIRSLHFPSLLTYISRFLPLFLTTLGRTPELQTCVVNSFLTVEAEDALCNPEGCHNHQKKFVERMGGGQDKSGQS